jgi:hypothetical protein
MATRILMRPGKTFVLASTCLTALYVQGLSGAGAPAPPGEYVAVERFISEIERPPVAYQAVRRLEASSPKLNESAWMDAFTEYDASTGFRYRVTAQGGSDRIRNRVLKSVLEAEKENSAQREWHKGALSRDNYEFNFDGRTSDGLIKVQLNPRRRDSRLVDGAAWLSAPSGALVRLEGRLSKSPSFWVRWVSVTRRYRPIRGEMMPVAVESTADVRMAGVSTFAMRYEYQTIAGQNISTSLRILASR